MMDQKYRLDAGFMLRYGNALREAPHRSRHAGSIDQDRNGSVRNLVCRRQHAPIGFDLAADGPGQFK